MMLHGGNIIEYCDKYNKKLNEVYDFSANLHPFGLRDDIKEVIKNNIEHIAYYPRSSEFLNELIANKHSVNISNVYLGNGACNVLYKILLAISSPLKVLLFAPNFLEYELATKQISSSTIIHYMLKNKLFIEEDVFSYIDKCNLIVICNPNNPCGNIFDKNIIENIIDYSKKNNKLVLIDECFLDFVINGESYSFIPYINKYKNLIILKSFTKLYSIPGLRLGYAITSNKYIMNRLNELTPAWHINSLSIAVAKYILSNHILEGVELDKLRDYISKERDFLSCNLQQYGVDVITDSRSNFLFFSCDNDKIYNKLLKKNILIRSCANYKNTNKYDYRIAIKSREENKILINALFDER